MKIVKEKIEKSIKSIDKTTNLFYQNKLNMGYKQLEETILFLSDTVEEIFNYRKDQDSVSMEEKKLVDIFAQAMNAMENKDALLLADILQYDLKETLEQISLTY